MRHIRSSRGAGGNPSAEAIGVAFAKANGITGDDAAALAALRALPAAEGRGRASTWRRSHDADTYAGPMVDGVLMVEISGDRAFRAGRLAKVP